MNKRSTLISFLIIFTIAISFGQPGSLDGDFDADGKAVTDIGSLDDIAQSVAVQLDGKIVVAGHTGEVSGFPEQVDFAVVRYNIDGSLDNSFSVDGKVVTDFGDHDYGYSVVVQPDGKIIVAGYSFAFNNPIHLALLRYNADGTLDQSFSIDGKVIGAEGSARTVTLQSDGKILVAGTSSSEFLLVRYNTDGSLDSSFGSEGLVTTDIGSGFDVANSIAIQTDGKIVVAGQSNNGTDYDFAIARYHLDGTLDNTFSINGVVTTAFGNRDDVGKSLVIQPDGKIIVGGYADNAANRNEFAIVRYHEDGTLDNSFDTDGKVTTSIEALYNRMSSVVLQGDGKILTAGSSAGTSGTSNFTLARYTTDGTLDNTFDIDGIVTTAFGSGSAGAYGCAIQSNGRIVVVGKRGLELFPEDYKFAVARYISGSNLGVISFSKLDHGLLIYPNPLKENAVIEYTLTNDETISIDLYDISGRLVQSFIKSEKRNKGTHKESLAIDASTPSGTYILSLNNGVGKSSIRVVK